LCGIDALGDTIYFTLRVRIEVFNILDQHVATAEAGEHKVHFDASHLSSGVYFYWLAVRDAALIGRMVLVQ
jgi:hypothetical protein